MIGQCRLCCETRDLQASHVVPAFVYRWLKDTSATGFIRFGQNPNKRVQDGYKENWLCAECEGRFSVFETKFATKIFHPFNEGSRGTIRYDEWLLKFCASVSWRTLLKISEIGLEDFSTHQKEAVVAALTVWSKYLLGELPNPGQFEQHILPLDAIVEASSGAVPANINRYILRSVDLDAVRSESVAFVLTKMSKYVVLGFIDVKFPRQWQGTKISARQGIFGSGDFTIPVQFRDYLYGKAERYAETMQKISDRQHEKMDAAMWRDIDRVANSGSFKAMQHDVNLSGKSAFLIHRPKKTS
jgi:hypothetical protein